MNPATENELPAYALVSAHLDEPVDEDFFCRQDEEAFRYNYETGMDTWEEYQENLKGLDKYAKIVEYSKRT